MTKMITYNKIKVDDCNVFYREAGSNDNPAILLLHGFPSASHMFRELMPQLCNEYYLVAPDFPGFGQTESPSRNKFEYSFDHLAKIVDKFTEQIGLSKFSMYVFDYGAPIGYRLALWHPERITAIVSKTVICMKRDWARSGMLARHIGRIPRQNFVSSFRQHLPLKQSSDSTLSAHLKAA